MRSHSFSRLQRSSSEPLTTNHHLMRLPVVVLNLRRICSLSPTEVSLLRADVTVATVVVFKVPQILLAPTTFSFWEGGACSRELPRRSPAPESRWSLTLDRFLAALCSAPWACRGFWGFWGFLGNYAGSTICSSCVLLSDARSPDHNCNCMSSLIFVIVQPTPQNCDGHEFDCMV